MAKPSQSVAWALNNTSNGTNTTINKIAPTSNQVDFGWNFPEKPPRNIFNYWQNAVYLWVAYLDAEIDNRGSVGNQFAIDLDVYDPSIRVFAWRSGNIWVNGNAEPFSLAAGNVTQAANEVRYYYVNINTPSTVQDSTIQPDPNDSQLLYKVTTDSTIISDVVDYRSWATRYRSATKGDIDTATTDLKFINPARLLESRGPAEAYNRPSFLQQATNGQAITGVDNFLAVSPASLAATITDRLNTAALLPLVAGPTNPLSGNLYVKNTAPSTRYQEDNGGGIVSDYGWVADNDNMTLRHFVGTDATGGAGPYPLRYDPTQAQGDRWSQHGSKFWTQGNMGSGSGLDADKLEGLEGTTAPNANTAALRDAQGFLDALGYKVNGDDLITISGDTFSGYLRVAQSGFTAHWGRNIAVPTTPTNEGFEVFFPFSFTLALGALSTFRSGTTFVDQNNLSNQVFNNRINVQKWAGQPNKEVHWLAWGIS